MGSPQKGGRHPFLRGKSALIECAWDDYTPAQLGDSIDFLYNYHADIKFIYTEFQQRRRSAQGTKPTSTSDN